MPAFLPKAEQMSSWANCQAVAFAMVSHLIPPTALYPQANGGADPPFSAMTGI